MASHRLHAVAAPTASAPQPEYNPQACAVAVGELTLENGAVLPDVVMTYECWGELNDDASNAVLVEHALTGDSHVVGPIGPGQPTAGWWPGLIGPGAPLDTDEFFIVAINVLGGCRGSTGPTTPGPDGRAWAGRFPHVSVRDQVRAEARVADALGIASFHTVIGGSFGGMRAAEWVATFGHRVQRALVIASAAAASADQIAWGHTQVSAIEADPEYRDGFYREHGTFPTAGLGLARQIAHTSYRSAHELQERFGRAAQGQERPLEGGRFAVQSYLEHHARKLAARFDAVSYVRLTQAMAVHDVGRGRGGLEAALRPFAGELVVAAVDSDRLFPVVASADMVRAHGRGRLRLIHSPHGHDGFLIETEQVSALVREVVARPVAAAAQRVRPVA